MYPRNSIYVLAIFLLISLFHPQVIVSAKSTAKQNNTAADENARRTQSLNINENKNILVHEDKSIRRKQHRIKNETDGLNVDNDLKIILEKLNTAHLLRDNCIFVMGYILRLPEGHISAEYYSSLQIIYHALKQRQIYTYDLLSSMLNVVEKSNGEKFRQLLIALTNVLPPYMECSAKYWIDGIDNGKIDINEILSSKQENLDILTGISNEKINIFGVENLGDELESYDESSKITEELMGPVYVKLFEQIVSGNIQLSQQLFGMILMDLPNVEVNPIFEEYVRYISERAWRNKFTNWDNYEKNPRCMNPYALLINIVESICKDSKVSLTMKKALLYIRNYLSSRGTEVVPTTTNEVNQITQNGLDVDLLFSTLKPQRYNENLSKLTEQLNVYLKNEKNKKNILDGMNRYAYMSSRELLLAFLARLQIRLPAREVQIQRIVSALISNLVIKTEIWDISSPLKGAASLWMIIDVINEPNADPKISEMIIYILNELMSDLTLWDSLEEKIILKKENCVSSEGCVLIILEKLATLLPKDKVKPKLITTIVNLISIVRNNTAKCENGENCPVDQVDTTDKPNSIIKPDKPKDSEMIEQFEPPKDISKPQKLNEKNPPLLDNIDNIDNIDEVDDVTIEKDEIISTPGSDYSMPLPPKTPILPPTIFPTKCIVVAIPKKGPPLIETRRSRVDHRISGAVILPSVIDLQEKPNSDQFILPCGEQFDRRIRKPLINIHGQDFMLKILGDGWISQYPTKIALLIALLRAALNDPKVQKNLKLIAYIKITLKAVQFVTPYLFLPMLSHWKDFDVPIVWSTFGTHDESLTIIGRKPPGDNEVGTVTIPLVNPKSWLLPVESGDPFSSLLPQLPKGNNYEVELRPLVAIFNFKKMKEILGKDIRPSLYPNRGALLVFTLQRLITIEKIRTDVTLFTIIKNYLTAIERPAAFIKISQNYISRELGDLRGSWTVDLLELLKALPSPSSKSEMTVWLNMRDFLSKINLLDELEIPLPTVNTTRAKFLSNIIRIALKTKKIILDDRIRTALNYYKDKVNATKNGAMNISWIWIQKFTLKTEIHLGEMIEDLVPYDNLPNSKKVAYNDLVTFLAQNPRLLQNNQNVRLSKHKSMNHLLAEILRNLMKNPEVPEETKKNISLLLPHLKTNHERMKKIYYTETKEIN